MAVNQDANIYFPLSYEVDLSPHTRSKLVVL